MLRDIFLRVAQGRNENSNTGMGEKKVPVRFVS